MSGLCCADGEDDFGAADGDYGAFYSAFFVVHFCLFSVANIFQVLVGVHGNGLTVRRPNFLHTCHLTWPSQHQLFMPPSPRSTVVEIFAPKSKQFAVVMHYNIR